MDIVTRLKQFMDFTQLPSSQFADMAQIPRPTLSQIMNGRNKKISNELISKLHEAFPQLNVLWLMFGDGDMVFGENIEFSEALDEQNLFSQESQLAKNEIDTNIEIADKKDALPTPSTQNRIAEAETAQNATPAGQETRQPDAAMQMPLPIITDSSKKIASIMVFYTDNSFERFIPAENANQ